jgi:phenylacetate-CoA ligase
MLFGAAYRDTRELLRRTERWSADQHRAWQLERLRELLVHCGAHVPYYRKVFAAAGFDPARLADPAELRALPYLTKETLRADPAAFRAGTYRDDQLIRVTTGGSTGQPLGFLFDKARTRQIEKAFLHDHWSRVGYRFGDPVAALRGAALPDGAIATVDALLNTLVLSPFGLTAERAPDYLARLDRFAPRFLWGYPSTLYQLAQEIERQSLARRFAPRAVICASEKVFPFQRRLLERVFQCRVTSYYGLSEYTVCGAECEGSSDIHLYPQYGFTELVPVEGERATSADVQAAGGTAAGSPAPVCEIIATGFNNLAFPFVRYRTGDLAVPASGDACAACGRHYPRLEDVIGRAAEFVVTRSGRLVSLTSLIFAQHFTAFERIRKLQLEQRQAGRLVVRVVKAPDFGAEDARELERVIERCVGEGELDVELDDVEEIPATERGKHRFLIQGLDVGEVMPAT